MFLRPRRWEKSAFLDTLADYYDKGKKDLFDDTFGQLYIGKHPTPYRSSLLVLLFDFSTIGVYDHTKADLDRMVNASVERFLEKNAKFLGNPDLEELLEGSGPESLERVLTLVKERGEKLFVGVDEYDTPGNSCIFSNDPETRSLYRTMADILKSQFFAVMKQASDSGVVQKYWVTGVLPAFRDGDSPLSSTTIVSMLPEYHGLCGLTHDEVRTIAEACLGHSPELDAHLQEMKRWFNGYRFCREGGIEAATLYNPQQVFTHLHFFRSGGCRLAISEEDNTILSSIVVNSMHQIGPHRPDFFLDAWCNRLPGDVGIMHEFEPWLGDGTGTGNERLAQTLLYYFGVLAFHPQTGTLGFPNTTVLRFIGTRLRFRGERT